MCGRKERKKANHGHTAWVDLAVQSICQDLRVGGEKRRKRVMRRTVSSPLGQGPNHNPQKPRTELPANI